MSEAEIKQRLAYKKNRKKWIIIQAILITIVSLVTAAFLVGYFQVSETYYIDYTESSKVDYSVQLKENNFYDSEWIEKDQAYISSLISNILADFEYSLDMVEASSVKYAYSYSIDAQLKISNKQTGTVIYDPVFVLKEEESFEQSSKNHLVIRESVFVDYNKYNGIADQFVRAYELKQVTSMLVVSMHVDVTGSCDEFESDAVNSYVVSLNIPLGVDTVEMNTTASVPAGETQVLACSSAVNKDIFLMVAVISGAVDLILICILLIFTFLTKNEDVTYTNKIKKLVSAYGSYIQRVENEFDTEGYQLLAVKTFNEMLSIRDTIQSPVLMCENRDQTLTRFIIPTNTKILYVFEIRVDNYDEIYGINAEDDELVVDALDEEAVEEDTVEEEPVYVEETVIIEENVDEEALEEALASPDVILSEIDYVEDDDEDYDETEEEPGVEVIGVVWPERAHKNKVYRYDPNGEKLTNGDVVLVPSRDAARDRNIIRKAAVAHGNHKVDPEHLHHPLKKIIGVVKRKAEQALTPDIKE